MIDRDLSIRTLVPQTTNQDLVRDRLRNTTFVGIDFGTSTTVASYAVPGDVETPIKAEPIGIPQKMPDGATYSNYLVPSVVAWYNDQLFVGAGARQLREENRVKDGRTVWSSFKMDLGLDLGAQYPQSVLKQGHEVATIETPKQAAAVFLEYLRRHIERFVDEQGLPTDIQYSISIPAAFEPNQREDLMDALQTAGVELPEQALIDEPNAAFLNFLSEANMYAGRRGLQIPSESPLRVLVFDFGAGTCDISILEIGEGPGGFYSKNLAISRFEVLGGDNIDRQIVREILIDQLCEQSGIQADELRRTDVERRLIPALKSQAERLKIAASKRVASEMLGRHLPSLAESADESVTLDVDIEVRLPRETLYAETLHMPFNAFQNVMEPFLQPKGAGSGTSDDVVSVFQPIQSAIGKSGLETTDLDMVLLIGGSSKNPYVQAALHQHFDEYAVEVETPKDLRAHVSTGAAVNSLLLNGLDVSIVKPITSEPIFAIVKDATGESLYTLIEASTEIPSPVTTIDELRVGKEGQESVQIPICVGTRDKIMSTLEVKAPGRGGFEKGTRVCIDLEITRDKLLRAQARVGDQVAEADVVHPFANRELTPQERSVREAEKAANNAMARRGGRAAVPVLLNLAEACGRAGDHQRAAEIMEQVQMMDASQNLQTSITYHYDRAGRNDLALKWAKNAFDERQNPTTAYNVAVTAWNGHGDEETYVEYLEKALDMRGSHVPSLTSLGTHLHSQGNDRGKELLEKAYRRLKTQHDSGQLDGQEARSLRQVARILGHEDVADAVTVEASDEFSQSSGPYNEDRLAHRSNTDALTKS
jgi:molecular chaperone DnaK (HSP70)